MLELRGRKARLKFHAYNDKIAENLTQADTEKHTLDISAFVPANCVAVFINSSRKTGTESLYVYPNEGTNQTEMATWRGHIAKIAISSQRIQYSLSMANDTFDVYLLGYETEGG